MKRGTLRWAILGLQTVVVAVVLYFIGRAVVDLWPQIVAIEWTVDPLLLAPAAAIGLVCQGLLIVGWRLALRLVGAHISWAGAVESQAVGQLAKYVPGKVMTLVGKVYLARKFGVPEPQAALAMFVEVGTLTLTGLIVGLACAVQLVPAPRLVLIGLLLLAGAAMVLHPSVLPRAINGALRLLRRPTAEFRYQWSAAAPLLACYLATWLLWGVGVWLLAGGLGLRAPLAPLMGGNALGWVAGFLSFIFPGGLGVREYVLARLLASAAPGVAMSIALVSRAWLLGAEVAWALGAWLGGLAAHRRRLGDDGP
ncbi:MAG: hypothetical protein FJX74_06655 [Armatimonadetes bacterium]|nr:hypothetical protein [Armatimonadota bacterium]